MPMTYFETITISIRITITIATIIWLETIHLTTAIAKKLNAFQMRGIRKILNKAPLS